MALVVTPCLYWRDRLCHKNMVHPHEQQHTSITSLTLGRSHGPRVRNTMWQSHVIDKVETLPRIATHKEEVLYQPSQGTRGNRNIVQCIFTHHK